MSVFLVSFHLTILLAELEGLLPTHCDVYLLTCTAGTPIRVEDFVTLMSTHLPCIHLNCRYLQQILRFVVTLKSTYLQYIYLYGRYLQQNWKFCCHPDECPPTVFTSVWQVPPAEFEFFFVILMSTCLQCINLYGRYHLQSWKFCCHPGVSTYSISTCIAGTSSSVGSFCCHPSEYPPTAYPLVWQVAPAELEVLLSPC